MPRKKKATPAAPVATAPAPTSKPEAKRPGPQGSPKADFIKKFPPTASAREIIEAAKKAGLTVSATYVSVVRGGGTSGKTKPKAPPAPAPAKAAAPPKKKRGRPSKSAAPATAAPAAPKRGPGRPRRTAPAPAPTAGAADLSRELRRIALEIGLANADAVLSELRKTIASLA